MLPKEFLKEQVKRFSVILTESELSNFDTYSKFLVEYNTKVNLTTIIEPNEIAVRHFEDSLALLKYCDLMINSTIIDVGTGGGFPAVPLKIVRADLDITLLDSANKKLIFLNQLADMLNIKVTTVHSRAEDAGANPKLREKYDYTTSRAVAHLSVLAEYSLPLLKIGGKMIVLKGPNCQEEIAAADNAIKLLGGRLADVFEYELSDRSRRTLIIIEKILSTPKKYPRQRVKLSDKPL